MKTRGKGELLYLLFSLRYVCSVVMCITFPAAPVKGAGGRLCANIITYGNVISSEGDTTVP